MNLARKLWGLALTDEVEAEDGEGQGSEERENLVEADEGVVQKRRQRRVDEEVEHDLEEPAERQNGSNHSQHELGPESEHRHRPGVPRIVSLHRRTTYSRHGSFRASNSETSAVKARSGKLPKLSETTLIDSRYLQHGACCHMKQIHSEFEFERHAVFDLLGISGIHPTPFQRQ